jgi:sugar lactone lactonase YvrE
MAAIAHILRDMRQILLPNAEQHAIPSLDGAFSPNEALDHFNPIGAPMPGADDVAEGKDGALYVSAGRCVLRLSGPGYATRVVVAEFESAAGGLTVHPDGRLLVCVAGRGLAAVDPDGTQFWLRQIEDEPLDCLTSVATAPDGAIFASEGSRLNPPTEWRRDLMQKNRAGRVIVCGPGFEAPKVVLCGLPYPHGLALSTDGRFLWLTQSWSHGVCRAPVAGRGLGAVERVIPNLPGYPARLGPAAGGGFWLSIFALRTHLVEFVLREDDFRDEMMRTIAPDYWIAPALATSGDALEPMQNGSIKALGVQKPWAPPRSYGLIARIDDGGEVIESLHSRVGGRYHGVTSARETEQGLVAISKGRGCALLDPSGVKR